MGEPPPIHWEETTVLDHSRGQESLLKEAIQIQMTCGEALEMRRTGNPWLLDHHDGQAGREEQSLQPPMTSSAMHGYIRNSSILFTLFHFHPDDDWSIQSKYWQKLKLVADNLLVHSCRSQLKNH